MNEQAFQPVRLADYQPPEFLVEDIFLTFLLAEESTVVRARSTFRRNPLSPAGGNELRLPGEHLQLSEVCLDDHPLDQDRYRVTDRCLIIADVPEIFTLEVVTTIHPDKNTALSGLYRSSGIFCTQCEAEGFRRITYFPDRPDVLTRFRTRIEAFSAACPILLANGNLTASGSLDNGRHFVEWQDPFPKPSYLFALVAGELSCLQDSFTTKSGREITLQVYVRQNNRDKCAHAMASLKKAMKWDEEVYGLEYDLDRYMIVAVDDFNMGAMENKGLNLFNAKYVLASPESATDQDYLGIEGVIAHEYFHNWTGNRVTCRDWFQLSLKEGLTVFRDQQFSADMNSAAVQRIEDVRILRQFQFREDAGPTAHPIRPEQYLEINNFYTVTVYNKGAEVIRMLQTLLGWTRFRKGMDRYFQRHDGQAVTCDDFVAAMADASGIDLSRFKRWYSQAGTPRLTVSEQWQEGKGVYRLTIGQATPATPGQPDKQPLHMPIVIGLLDRSGGDMAPVVRCSYERRGNDIVLELSDNEQSFDFQGFKDKPVLSFLRGFSAPVQVEPFHSREELAFLMKNDSDLFNRWDASFSLAETVILALVEELSKADGQPVLDPIFLEAMRHNLLHPAQDRSLTALALRLPEENHLLQKMKLVDPVGLHRARRFVKLKLAELLSSELLALYRANEPSPIYQVTGEQVGRRSIRTACLDYLTSLAKTRADLLALCRDHYYRSTTMTDLHGALAAIVQVPGAERAEIFSHFENKWRDNALAMDKWFALQAGSPAEDTFARVQSLLRHPKFSLRNPNKVRSLIGTFGQNHYHFHDSSGRGYRFLSGIIGELDPLNPQVAARLVTPFLAWKRYDTHRQHLMRAALEEIGGKKGVSRDVYEMVGKGLDSEA